MITLLFLTTVKLGIKELLIKEETGFKELFTDYQPFYTINLQLNKELLPIVKIGKKGDFRNFFDQFWDFTLKRVPEIRALYENLLEPNL